MILVIGSKAVSSWSLRPWLLMKQFGIPFEEKLIALDTPSTALEIKPWSPSGKVPVLVDGPHRVWESMAICEYIAEKYPSAKMWPRNPRHRAMARSIANEMHGGFQAMRSHLPHQVLKTYPGYDWSPVANDIKRVQAIWKECLEESGGPFLFGEFSIADAMYAPVANRFVTYDVPCEGILADYRDRLRALPAMKDWVTKAAH